MKASANDIQSLILYYKNRLNNKFPMQEAGFFIRQIVSHYCQIDFSELPIHHDKRLSESEILRIHFAVESLENDTPLQYVLGETEFLSCKIKVNPSVLIPRPETEEMVSLIIEEYKNHTSKLNILDVATGSGCIAISLKKNLNSNVLAIDNSSDALEVAHLNSVLNGLEINFRKTDILNKSEFLPSTELFDIIVSNPPYVCESEKVLMQKNVLDHEPHAALFVTDNDPLIFYTSIVNYSIHNLKVSGQLWFEINERFEREMIELLELNFGNVQIIKDFRGKVRFAKSRKLS